jgi:hypothetical protein
MSDLIRILYISRATFEVAPEADGGGSGEKFAPAIPSEVEQILLESRVNNRQAGVVGMLFYDAGHFFQCIEGDRKAVEALYRRLLKDPRHRDLKLLGRHRLERLSYPDWSMKYVPVDRHARRLLEQHGFERFDPYRFDDHLIERMLHLMQGAVDPTAIPPESLPSSPSRPAGTSTVDGSASQASGKALVAALAMSSTALLISLATLVYVLLLS